MQLISLRRGLLGIVIVMAVGSVHAEDESLRPVLIEAIRTGTATGEMSAQVREAFAHIFGSNQPIRVKVERLEAVKPRGCYRLRVTTTQAGVYEVDPKTKVRATTPSEKSLAYRLNYCANGHFPEEGGGE